MNRARRKMPDGAREHERATHDDLRHDSVTEIDEPYARPDAEKNAFDDADEAVPFAEVAEERDDACRGRGLGALRSRGGRRFPLFGHDRSISSRMAAHKSGNMI